eukprot:scpid80195/ scgid1685/ 
MPRSLNPARRQEMTLYESEPCEVQLARIFSQLQVDNLLSKFSLPTTPPASPPPSRSPPRSPPSKLQLYLVLHRRKMDAIIARNVNGTGAERYQNSKSKSPYESWIDLWKGEREVKARQAVCCSVMKCPDEGTLGGHVRFPMTISPHVWYIVPICASHNQMKNKDLLFHTSVRPVAVVKKRRKMKPNLAVRRAHSTSKRTAVKRLPADTSIRDHHDHDDHGFTWCM